MLSHPPADFSKNFNSVMISEKINIRYPSSDKWLNWGAIVGGIMCLIDQGMIGITPADIIQEVTIFLVIYGMLVAKDITQTHGVNVIFVPVKCF